MSFGHALYYPHINLVNKNWIKHAFLFWDHISRIVPYSVDPMDSEDIIKLKYETGFIKDYSPESYITSRVFHSFSRFLEDFIQSNQFYRHYRRYYDNYNWEHDYYQKRRFQEDLDFRRSFIESVTRAHGTYIHVQKLDRNLKKRLFEMGLAIPGEHEYEDWVRIDNEIGFLYMSYLANEISKSKSLPLVTDTNQFFIASTYFNSNQFRNYKEEFEYKLGNLLISSFIPQDINSIPMEKLIEVKNKYTSERLAFFNSISELCQNIPAIDNESALRDALNHYSSSLIEQSKELKKAYESNKIKTIYTFLSISVPSSIASLSSLIPVEYKPLGIGAGILFGTINSINSVKIEKENLRQKPLSYLLNVNSELSGEGLFRAINDGIMGVRRF